MGYGNFLLCVEKFNKPRTMFGKIFTFNVFSSEKKQREYESGKKDLVERKKLDHGTMLMFKTAHSEYATLCSFVRVCDLALFVSEMFRLAQTENISDLNSMKNLQHSLFKGKLWIVIGGDKARMQRPESHLVNIRLERL